VNKTTIFLTFSGLAAIMAVCSGVIAVVRPEGFLTFTSFVGIFLGIVISAAVTINALSKTNETARIAAEETRHNRSILETVRTNTNGALAQERYRVEALKRALPPGTDIRAVMNDADAEFARAHYRQDTNA
jgi:hypothetical protein